MNRTIGFIGSGNMGGAIIGGLISSRLVSPGMIIGADVNEKNLSSLKKKYGIETTKDNLTAVRKADILFLSVKPNIYPAVIAQVKNALREETIVVTIAAGQSISYIESLFEKPIKLVRAMPNTPALAGEGMTALCPNEHITDEDAAEITAIFNSFGKSELIREDLMDAVGSVSGSSPAYVYMFIEAMADAAVADGMPRPMAYKFAAQAVLGSAKMVLESGMHPGALKDMVCSPGGTTIEGVAILEKEGLRNAVITAQRACTEKSKRMTK